MNVEDCLANVRRCIDLANNVKDERTQSTLFEQARAWTEVACQLGTNGDLRLAVKEGGHFQANAAVIRPAWSKARHDKHSGRGTRGAGPLP
jgi:hypothetical protein